MVRTRTNNPRKFFVVYHSADIIQKPMKKVSPNKLQKGDVITVIAPSTSMSIINEKTKNYAKKRFEDMGLKVKYAKHVNEIDEFNSSSIESRLKDLHNAFSDKEVKAVIAIIGGFNSNQLLKYIDWDLIKSNPKIFCGFSDITVLNNAIYAKSGLITYSGPYYSTFGQKLHLEYTIDYFQKCLMAEEPFYIKSSENWSNDEWYKNQDDRYPISNEGYWVLNEGRAEGTIIGANLCTFNLLQGTKYMPSLKDTVLFIEDDYESLPHTFDRDLQSLIHQPGFEGVRGIVIGRFVKESKMSRSLLEKIVKTKKELNRVPVIANADFGHTDPKITFPIGGFAKISASKKTEIKIIKH